MSDTRLRDLERTVREGGDEAARVALDVERRRRGMPSLWGYAPRWCEASTKAPTRHLPGAQYACADCDRARAEAAGHVKCSDMPTNGSRWQLRARNWVALVLRITPPGSPATREVREALKLIRPSKHGPAIERQWFSKEAVRAFPELGRKKPIKDHWKGEADAPLFGEGVSRG